MNEKLIELGIALIQGAFTLLAMAKMTPEQIDALYTEQKTLFLGNKPEDLPDPT